MKTGVYIMPTYLNPLVIASLAALIATTIAAIAFSSAPPVFPTPQVAVP